MGTSTSVVKTGPNHVLHLILSICTGGLWLPIWFILALKGANTTVITSTTQDPPR